MSEGASARDQSIEAVHAAFRRLSAMEHPDDLRDGALQEVRRLACSQPSAVPEEFVESVELLVGHVSTRFSNMAADADRAARQDAEANTSGRVLRDGLTGLPNRRLLRDRLGQALKRRSEGRRVAVLYIDLVDFKSVNDTFGHDVGDELLVEVAQRIVAETRAHDTVARLGGDEFAVLCDGAGTWGASLVADRIARSLARPVEVLGVPVRVEASIGIAAGDHGQHPDRLLHEADAARTRAKRRGERVGFPELVQSAGISEEQLRLALERDELRVVYQPIRNLHDGSLAGAEALVRWQHPVLGRVQPDEFVPLAERTGLIVPLDRWVLDRAMRQLADWRRDEAVHADFTISVNISASHVPRRDLPFRLGRLLDEHRLDPETVVIEITESTPIDSSVATAEAVRAISELGVGVSLDDFGTGGSSLSYLRYLPASQLKIAPQFVSGLTTDPHDEALVRAAITLAHSFGMTCVAEGVETPQTLARLRELGCDYAQGFHLGAPADALDLELN